MNEERYKPFKLSPADAYNVKAAREALMRVAYPPDTPSMTVEEIVAKARDSKELCKYVNEIIADLEWLLGYQ